MFCCTGRNPLLDFPSSYFLIFTRLLFFHLPFPASSPPLHTRQNAARSLHLTGVQPCNCLRGNYYRPFVVDSSGSGRSVEHLAQQKKKEKTGSDCVVKNRTADTTVINMDKGKWQTTICDSPFYLQPRWEMGGGTTLLRRSAVDAPTTSAKSDRHSLVSILGAQSPQRDSIAIL